MRSARASASRQRPNGAGRSIRLKGISYEVGRKLAAAGLSPQEQVSTRRPLSAEGSRVTRPRLTRDPQPNAADAAERVRCRGRAASHKANALRTTIRETPALTLANVRARVKRRREPCSLRLMRLWRRRLDGSSARGCASIAYRRTFGIEFARHALASAV
jgi:hypothetical protein